MNTIEVVPYSSEQYDTWNEFVENSNNGTIFHRQDFLAYHPEGRFNFLHLMFYKKGELIAVLPGGKVGDMFKSPMGASFGGFVVNKHFGIEDADEIVKALIRYCSSQMIKEIYLTPPMQIYCDLFNESVEYAMHYNHFILISSLYSSIIDFSHITGKESLSKNTRHKINKAINKGITIVQKNDFDVFYPILSKNKEKFDARPTHSIDELKKIEEFLPGMMTLFMAYYEGQPVAGELLFAANKQCNLNFYTMHLYEYHNLFAVNYLVENSIRWCKENGFRYMDYGVSADTFNPDPMEPSWSLIQFKESMGATGCRRNTYYRRVF
ncbi:MAG: GNAT family N-acetyltransferase [Chitinivibrionales bacterium]|nr:GNAT family N-acetyltransferase [Chitinivibrionales bacterium]